MADQNHIHTPVQPVIPTQEAEIVKEKSRVYSEQIVPLLNQIDVIAKQHGIPYLTVFELDGWLKIEKRDIGACSELSCAYGELTSWSEMNERE